MPEPDHPLNPEEEAVIEEHARQLMEPGLPDPAPMGAPSTNKPKEVPPPPLDIFEGKPAPVETVTAPEVAGVPAPKTPNLPNDPEAPAVSPSDAPAEDVTENSETDKAVDEITKTEGDEVLKAEDQAGERAVVMKPKLWERFKNGWANWWEDPRKRYGTLAGLAILIITIAAVPVTRYFVLNTVGVRSHVNLKVLDNTTDLPLKNVKVILGSVSGKTDENGKLTLNHVKLGSQTITIQKAAFAPVTKQITVGFGGVDLASVSLKAVGSQFTFNLADYLSGKAVAGAQVASGEASALSDKNGKAILTVQPTDTQKLDVQVSADGYRTEQLTLNPTVTKPTAVALVTDAPEVYVTKASGKYDLYRVDIDGKNRKLLLAATGTENQNIALSVSPDNSEVALVSTRDNQRDTDGFLLSTVTLLKTSGANVTTIDHAEQVSLLGWVNDKLVYEETAAGASAANPNRQRIIAYDYGTNKRLQLTTANYFNYASVIGSTVYFAVSSSQPGVAPSLSKMAADGTNKQTILSNKEVWTVFRIDYQTLALQTPSGWLSYAIGGTTTKPGAAPGTYASRQYVMSSDGAHSLWVDNRDGRGVLLNYDVTNSKDTAVTTQSGLSGPLRWLNDTAVVYRVSTAQETADYVVSTAGGQPHKVTDVTSTYALS